MKLGDNWGFVATHAGAGFRLNSTLMNTEKLCKKAAGTGLSCLFDFNDPARACASAVQVLESSPITNAAVGSNLTSDSTVECEAALMESAGMRFAAIGAVSTILNPIHTSYHLLNLHRPRSSSILNLPVNPFHPSLVIPSVLVGDGAHQFSSLYTPPVSNDILISDQAVRRFKAVKNIVGDSISEHRLDTVGAICINASGSAAASSSGGLLLKHPGRLGHCTVFGAGVWAEDQDHLSSAVSVSGCGEYLVRTHLAQKLAHSLINSSNDDSSCTCVESVCQTFRTDFSTAKSLRDLDDPDRKLAGAIALIADRRENTLEFIWIHNTESLCFAYISGNKSAKSIISDKVNESSLFVGGFRVV